MAKREAVRLMIRVRNAAGVHRFYPASFSANGRLTPSAAVVGGKVELHPKGVYHLRYTDASGVRRFESIGRDASEASVMHRQRNLLHASRKAGLTVQEAPETRMRLADAVAEYIIRAKRYRTRKSHSELALILPQFLEVCGRMYLDQLVGEDLLKFGQAMRLRGLAPRTISNRTERVCCFLRHYKISDLLERAEMPTYVEKEPQAYNEEDLRRLFQVCDIEDAVVFRFFLASGLREQEVANLSYRNLNLNNKTVTVAEKLATGFQPKNRKERSVPLPDAIIAELARRRRENPDATLIFPTKQGKVEGHFLRRLKRIAWRNGLNCGECINRTGDSCRDSAVCSKWQLHSFRRSFATFHSEANVPVRRIQQWLGHHSLDVTLRYIDSAETRNARTREWVNNSFASI